MTERRGPRDLEKLQGSELGGLLFRVEGLGFRIKGLEGLGVLGLRAVLGLGLRV